MLISQNTKKQIDMFLTNPANALVIESPMKGAGLDITYQLIRKLLDLDEDYILEDSQYFYKIEKDKTVVSLESILELIKKLKLKSLANKTINRVGLIIDAELMSEESQNAILKLLEEPPKDTVIILLTKSFSALKSTIKSRTALIKITKPSYLEFVDHYSTNKLTSDLKNKYDFADGNSDYYSQYINDDIDLSNSEDIILIKKFLTASKSDRLLMINDFCNDKLVFETLLFSLKSLIKIGLENSIKNNNNQSKMWISYLKAIEKTETGFSNAVNRKLLFTNLCLNM